MGGSDFSKTPTGSLPELFGSHSAANHQPKIHQQPRAYMAEQKLTQLSAEPVRLATRRAIGQTPYLWSDSRQEFVPKTH